MGAPHRRQAEGSRVSLEIEQPAAPALPRARPARLGYVDGLRALAALEVMGSHTAATVWPAAVPGALAGALVAPFGFSHIAVSVFIVLSGFSLMLPVARNFNLLPAGAWRFYLRRARRILPPYYLAMALSLALILLLIGHKTGTHWDVSLPVTAYSVLTHMLLLQDFSATDHATINHVFWSIAMECQIYLLFPALIHLWRRYNPLFCVLVIVALSLTLTNALIPTWIGHLPGYTVYSFAPQYIGLFAMGMFAASVLVNGRPRWNVLQRWYAWEAIALASWVFVIVNRDTVAVPLDDVVVGVGTVATLLAAAWSGRANPIRAILEWRPLVWIGGFSYSLYLIHAPLVQVLWQYLFHPLGLGDTATHMLLLVVGGPLVVLAAWGFWWFSERPFLNSPAWRRTAQIDVISPRPTPRSSGLARREVGSARSTS
jgi:peptidoglycan/LPS O-acetylase OafA/YrhL